MYKIGDKVICKNNEYYENQLTIGKSYEVLDFLLSSDPHKNIVYKINNDADYIDTYPVEYFYIKQEYRELKLNKLLNV